MGLPLISHLLVVFIVLSVVIVNGQNDGKYRPPTVINRQRQQPSNVNDGRYRPGNDGKYRPVNDGRYRPGSDGKYVHKDVKYIHTNVGGGQYTGTNERSGNDGNRYGGAGGTGNKNGAGILSNANNDKTPVVNQDGLRSVTAATKTTRKIATTTLSPRPTVLGKGSGEGGNGWRIIRDDNSVQRDGYHYLFETENGILAEESGRIENVGPDLDGLRSKGFYEYTGDDGALYRVDYVADTNGFVPQGDHIPKIPVEIQKLLAYLATKPPDTRK